jgi:hypothetical protein
MSTDQEIGKCAPRLPDLAFRRRAEYAENVLPAMRQTFSSKAHSTLIWALKKLNQEFLRFDRARLCS